MLYNIHDYILGMKIRLEKEWEGFLEEEKGASDMVAVMVLIVILIAVAVIFRDGLINAIGAVMERLTEFITKTK